MKKIVTTLSLVLIGLIAFAQAPCNPTAVTSPNKGYVLPDSATNFNHACIGLPYEQIVYIKAPKDTTVLVFTYTIDSFIINKNITGLPPGLTAEAQPGFLAAAPPNPKTNFERLKIKGDSIACIKISGTVPTGTSPGTYNLVIPVRLYAQNSILGILDTAASLTYYKIEVKGSPCWPASVKDIEPLDLSAVNIAPNPNQGVATLSFQATKGATYQVEVRNMMGQKVYSNEINANVGMNYLPIITESWANGTYIYTISDDKNRYSSKLELRK